ncbi:MAG: transporter substrate-binding domain-containing protein [Atopostipes suicloacalis]|nr:transporter substrate-binding domain-containing protein [Atopostipes suicloacalis]
MKKKMLLAISLLFTGLFIAACGNSEESGGEADQDKLAEIQEAGKLVMGTSPDYPPFEFYVLDDEGERQIVGSDIQLAKAIAEELGVELEIKATDFNGVIANIQSNAVDIGLAGFNYTEERNKVMQFSEGYAQEATIGYQGLMVTKETAEKYNSLEEIEDANLAIGAQGGSIQYELAQDLTTETKIKQYGTLDVGLAALNEGDIDAMVVATSSAEPMIASFPDLTILPEENFNLDPEDLYTKVMAGFPLGEEYDSLIEEVNKVIQEAKENGDIEKWQDEAKELSLEAVE